MNKSEKKISSDNKYQLVCGLKMELEYENGFDYWCDWLIEETESWIERETDKAQIETLINDIAWLRYKRDQKQIPADIRQRLVEEIQNEVTDVTERDCELLEPYIEYIEVMLPEIDDEVLKLACLKKIYKYDIRYWKTCISAKIIFEQIVYECVKKDLEDLDSLKTELKSTHFHEDIVDHEKAEIGN